MCKENKLTFLTYINRVITQHNIPPELVLNADQTPCSYVSMRKIFAKAVHISRESHSQPASQPASQVASNQFAISQNPRQQWNEAEMLMLIDNYSDQKQKELPL